VLGADDDQYNPGSILIDARDRLERFKPDPEPLGQYGFHPGQAGVKQDARGPGNEDGELGRGASADYGCSVRSLIAPSGACTLA
jgi:hypothetical protein